MVIINPIAPERSTVAEQHTPNSYCSKLQVVYLNELRDILALGYIRPWAILGSLLKVEVFRPSFLAPASANKSTVKTTWAEQQKTSYISSIV